jgi:sporulation protein YlmC with PRC-barrel domain
MKSIKSYIVGFTTCIILMSTIFITGFAEDALTVLLNQFPIFINGQPAQVEAYNINGRTFLALGDVAKYLDAKAVFNETDKKIEITAADSSNAQYVNSIYEIDIDKDTGEPIGAELVDYNGYKALKYQDIIYVNYHNIRQVFEIDDFFYLSEQRQYVYLKNEKKISINIDNVENMIRFRNSTYYKAELFNEFIGE